MKDISNNPGILPVNMGSAYLQSSTHILTHYFDISPIYEEFNKLISQRDRFLNSTEKKSYLIFDITENIKVIGYIENLIKEKFKMFRISRNKRGLIDGLGSIIKSISGNLDANDAERYDSIISEIKENQQNIAKQINKQYSVNLGIIEKFNNTISDIRHNEEILKERILLLKTVVEKADSIRHSIYAKDITQQLINLLNVVLNIMQDIENSVAFCKLQTLHSSIITGDELLQELSKISQFYKNQLPFPIIPSSINKYETLIKPKCFIKNQQIIYFLSVPLYDKESYELYYFLPTPSSNLNIIIPSSKYHLKSKDDLLPLDDFCVFINGYHCDKKQLTFQNNSCERKILFENDFSSCQHTRLKITENSLEYIPEINEYLAVLLQSEMVKENCHSVSHTKMMTGVILFDNNGCDTYISNRLLVFNDTTVGHAINFEEPSIKIMENSNVKFPEIKLRQLKIKKLENIVPIQLEDRKHVPDGYHLSATVISLILITIFGCLLIFKYFRRSRRNPDNNHDVARTQPLATDAIPF